MHVIIGLAICSEVVLGRSSPQAIPVEAILLSNENWYTEQKRGEINIVLQLDVMFRELWEL